MYIIIICQTLFMIHHIYNGKAYVDSLFWVADRFITEVLGEYEAGQSILQPCPHSDTLPRATSLIDMIPHLCVINQSNVSFKLKSISITNANTSKI